MTQYNVTFEYDMPEWVDMMVDAETMEAAEDMAVLDFEAKFPEANSYSITDVKEVSLVN